MKNGYNETTEAEVAERNEKAKKIYRYVNDVARRVDDAVASCRSISDLFAVNVEVQRQKLRDHCEKLIFLDPLTYGKKSIELIWRKVYYETVSSAKKHQESDTDNDNFLFTHIVSGIGHFHHLIARVQSEMKVKCNELDYTLIDEEEETDEMTIDYELQSLGRSIVHSCLIYLGDLSRYQAELFHTFDTSLAARYYFQAAHIDMTLGMPFNQLGNLYQDKNHNLDSVCYYIHCLSCSVPFDGAMGNLIKQFEKNNQFFESANDNTGTTQAEHIQITIANFLSLIEIWYLGNSEDAEIPQKCSLTAHELKMSMEFEQLPLPDIEQNYTEYIQALEEETLNPSYLNESVINKIVQICLFTIAKLSETDEKKAFSCKAFTLALLSQLLQKLLQQLKHLGFKNPANKYRKHSVSEPEKIEEALVNEDLVPLDNNNKTEETVEENSDDEVIDVKVNGDTKYGSKKNAKRRRRRRAASDDSDDSDTGTESSDKDSAESGSDIEMSDSPYESDDNSRSGASNEEDLSDVEVVKDKHNGDISVKEANKMIQNCESKDQKPKSDMKNKTEDNNGLKATEIQDFLRGNNVLASIKILQDWVLNEKDLIISCGESGESLFQCVVDLLNIFTFYFKPNSSSKHCNESYKILDYARSVAKKLELEYKTIPLPEDVNLRATNICKFDKDAAEWQLLELYKPSVYEENIIRILNFIDFGNNIAKIVPRIRFNRSMQILYLKKTSLSKSSCKVPHKGTREWHNSKKPQVEGEGGLLRRLGRLWLTSRVKELERYGRAAAPTLLALDAAALNLHLRKVKQLVKSRTFILLIPTVVVQELDNLKRDQSTARDAIRWLETQLQEGSRFVRAQRPGQSRPLPLLKCPKKAPAHVSNFIQILEFCHHFVADDKSSGGNGDPDSAVNGKPSDLLRLLTGAEPEEQYKEFSVTGAARAAGVTLEHIAQFHTKWRKTVHKNGKKR